MFTHSTKRNPTFLSEVAEANAVRVFIDNSNEFKEINQIYLSLDCSLFDSTIKKITLELENATTFTQILHSLERYDFQNDNASATAKTLGRFGMDAMLFFGGFLNERANFAYYASHLREKAVKKMADLGYSYDAPNLHYKRV